MNASIRITRKLASNVVGNNVSQVVQLLSLCALISGTMAAALLAGSLAVAYSVLGLALFLSLPLVALACVLGVTGALVWALVTDGYRRNANARAWLAEFEARCAREDAEWQEWQERTEALKAKLYARELTLAPMVVAMECDSAVQSVRLGMSEARREVVESVRAMSIPAPVYTRQGYTPVADDDVCEGIVDEVLVAQAALPAVAEVVKPVVRKARKASKPGKAPRTAPVTPEDWDGMDNDALAAALRANGHKAARKTWKRETLLALVSGAK